MTDAVVTLSAFDAGLSTNVKLSPRVVLFLLDDTKGHLDGVEGHRGASSK